IRAGDYSSAGGGWGVRGLGAWSPTHCGLVACTSDSILIRPHANMWLIVAAARVMVNAHKGRWPMSASLTFFPVSNGDMTLIRLENGQTILIDVNIRGAADAEDDGTPDVGSDLRERLTRDDEGRIYVDAFLLSHPDQDHITGLRNHFHLGPLDDWPEEQDKI